MDSTDTFIPGVPVPKARPRVTRKAGRWSTAFTPARTTRWEKTVALGMLAARSRRWPLRAAYRVCVEFYGASPTADLDNLGKSILDAGNGILWKDDRQIVDLRLIRATGKKVGVWLFVELVQP